MKKNILLISSKTKTEAAFNSIFESLSQEYNFSLFGRSGDLYNFFKEKKWPHQKRFFFKNLFQSNNFFIYLFFFLKPFLQIAILIELSLIRKKYSALLLSDLNEKILISPLSSFLKIKTIWLEAEDSSFLSLNKKVLKKYIKYARQNKIISLNEIFKHKIEQLGVAAENIFLINPAIEIKNNKYQENIFSKIAKNENNQIGKKFFTIGTITDLDDKTKIETLFSAFKNSMDIVPRMQLILVGKGPYSPDNNPWVKWLAKKMGIDTMVWFVTDTKNIKRWLDSFDIFVLSSRMLHLNDFKTSLYAMEARLAPLVPAEIGYDQLILDGKNGYRYDINNSSTLSDLIIKLYKNKRLSIDLGNNAKDLVSRDFQVVNMIENFKKIL